jgi:hypothetical protein
MWFDFGSEGVLERVLSDTGFNHIRVARHTIAQEMRSAEVYWETVVGISGRLQMLLQSIPAEVASSVKAKVMKAAESFGSGEILKIPCEEVIAWASK